MEALAGAHAWTMTNGHDNPRTTGRLRRAGQVLWRVAGAGTLVWAVLAGWPQLRAAAGVLRGADTALLLAALGSQLTALVLLSVSYRASLRAAGASLALRPAAGVTVRAAAVSRLLPGGGAAAALFAVRRLRDAGVPAAPAAAGVAVNAVITMGTLVAVVAAGGGGASRETAIPIAVTGVLMAVVAVALRGRRARQRLARAWARLRSRAPLRAWSAAVDALVADGLQWRHLAVAVGTAGAGWMCELGALSFAVAAVGHPLPLSALALGLGAANAAAAVPHTPGGVGVVEVAMTAAFVAAGLEAGVALAGVIAYRGVGFWLPVALGSALLAADATAGIAARRRDAEAVAA